MICDVSSSKQATGSTVPGRSTNVIRFTVSMLVYEGFIQLFSLFMSNVKYEL